MHRIEYMARKYLTEMDLYNFVRRYSRPLSMENFRKALELTRNQIKSQKSYRNGVFFKLLLFELEKGMTWEDAEKMENKFLQRLK